MSEENETNSESEKVKAIETHLDYLEVVKIGKPSSF